MSKILGEVMNRSTESDAFQDIFREYREISVEYKRDQEAVWLYMCPQNRPCFSPELLSEAKEFQQSIIRYFQTGELKDHPIRYMVLASRIPGIFSFGGDLNLFIQLITERKREKLFEYAKNCVDICYMNAVNMNLPVTTISLVEGSAFGGGFEAALSSNILIAEEHAKMGFPEIRFNLFPGMGAYSFLSRKAGTKIAADLLQSGDLYPTREMHRMTLVDVLADEGKGREAVDQFIKTHHRTSNGLQAIQAVKQFFDPVTYEELIGITEIWVDAALRLRKRDLKMMERIVSSQNRCSKEPFSNVMLTDASRVLRDVKTRNHQIQSPKIQIQL